MRQQLVTGCVQVHADLVHSAFDHDIDFIGQIFAWQVVLILTNTDRLWINLDEFGERILSAARNADGAALFHMQVGKFITRFLARRVN